jgi:hypothetical protein
VDFKIQSSTQKEFLARATKEYKASLPGSPAEEYLARRRLLTPENQAALSRFQIGFVDNPLPGHEWYKGWLAIPYLRFAPGRDDLPLKGWSVAGMKFRCLENHEGTCSENNHDKYRGHTGANTHIFITLDLQNTDDEIAICEGEIDAITAHLCGIPSIGIPGVQNWKNHYFRLLKGYKKLWMFADGDSYGEGLARKIEERMGDKLSVIKMPDGEDVSSMVGKYGKEALLRGMGRA